MSDFNPYFYRLDKARVGQILPNLNHMELLSQRLRDLPLALINMANALDISCIGFDLKCTISYITKSRTSGYIIRTPRDLTVANQRAERCEAATAHSMGEFDLDFYRELSTVLMDVLNEVREIQKTHPVLVKDYSNSLNSKVTEVPLRTLQAGDIYNSSRGITVMVCEIVNPEKPQVGVFGHMHSNPSLSVVSEYAPGDAKVELVGIKSIKVHWTFHDGTGHFSSREEAREASKGKQTYPMPQATIL